MFNLDELSFLFQAVEAFGPSPNTVAGRNKAAMMVKLCNLLDEAANKPEKDVDEE